MMRAEIRQAYFKYGWLIPAVLPLAQVTGRAVFTILGIVFLVWAGASLYGQRITLDRTVVSRYGVLLVAFLLSVPGATDSVQALSEWSHYLVYTSVFLIVALTLSTNSEGAPQLIRAFGLCGLALLAVLYLLLIVDVQRPGFKPTLSMHEDNLPFLTPFILYLINENLPLKHRKWTALAAGFLITAYVVLSEGRAALAGLIVALMSYAILVLGWRKLTAFFL